MRGCKGQTTERPTKFESVCPQDYKKQSHVSVRQTALALTKLSATKGSAMLTNILNTRSMILAVALSGIVGNAANAGTPKPLPANLPTKHFPQNLAKAAYARSFQGWTAYCFITKYQCNGYYSSATRLWYYWYAPFNRFLPISYLPIYPPTMGGIVSPGPVAGSATGSQPALPPDATPLNDPPTETTASPNLKKTSKPKPTTQDD